MLDKEHDKGEQHIHFKITKCKLKDSFDIFNCISENVTLVELMDTVVNGNHTVVIVVYWGFDSNYKKAPPFTT